MSEKGEGTRKEGQSTSKDIPSSGIPDEPAALQELEDRLMVRLLRRVRQESGSEETGELNTQIKQARITAGFPRLYGG